MVFWDRALPCVGKTSGQIPRERRGGSVKCWCTLLAVRMFLTRTRIEVTTHTAICMYGQCEACAEQLVKSHSIEQAGRAVAAVVQAGWWKSEGAFSGHASTGSVSSKGQQHGRAGADKLVRMY